MSGRIRFEVTVLRGSCSEMVVYYNGREAQAALTSARNAGEMVALKVSKAPQF